MIDPPSWLVGPDARQATNLGVVTQAWDAMLEAVGGSRRPLDPCADDFEFVRRYGLQIDGRPFDFNAYKHLQDVYRDTARFLVLMAGAQTGKTARVFAHLLRQTILHWGRMFGYYLPTIDLASKFSAQRFAPFAKSQPQFGQLLGSTTQKGRGTDNILTRSIGESVLFFLTTAGRSSTEGIPLQGVVFDEVRRMTRGDVERAQERYTAQAAPTNLKVSTALYPHRDIHAAFEEGDQRYFHTACGCPDGIVLSLSFPDCILDLRSADAKTIRAVENAFARDGIPYLGIRNEDDAARYPAAVYYCRRCDTIITDPQIGWWEPHNPGAFVHSYQMPQLLSPNFPAGRTLFRFEGAQDVQEFHNSTLGLPYLDEEARPIKEEHLLACVNTTLRWPARQSAAWRRANVANTAGGVDVQAGYLVLVIRARAATGKHRVVHLEILPDSDDESMWRTLGKRIVDWDMDACVIDNAPEWTEADRLARAFPRRVWLASYDTSGSQVTPIAVWGDATPVDKKQRAKETKFKHTVRINRVKGLRWSLGLWKHRKVEIPDPKGLVQSLPMMAGKVVLTAHLRRGTWAPYPLGSLLFEHLQQFMFRDVYEDPEQEEAHRRGQIKTVAEYISDLDPHFAHADLYSALALSRTRS